MEKKKVLVIVGQTATGKSALAVSIAQKIDGEIISADSRQVYKGLDIGTGKLTKSEMGGIPHHLIDVADPHNTFTVTEFKKLAEEKIADILTRNKTPIICGGTGFYIDAVTKGILFPEVHPDMLLRTNLEQKTLAELATILANIDPERMVTIDTKNKVRLIRAIEIATALGKVPPLVVQESPYEFIKIGLFLPILALQAKVQARVENMFEDGLLQEIRTLKKQGISDQKLKSFGFEYYNPTPENVGVETIKYAKRQMTWFKRDKDITWFDSSKKTLVTDALQILES